MFSTILKQEVENFATVLRAESPLFIQAQKGALQRAAVERYLANVLYLIRHTPIHLMQAAVVAEDRRQPQLARFFRDKMAEEVGHDLWAEEDLKSLNADAQDLCSGGKLTAAMRDLVASLADLINNDPALYVGYIFVAEYLTVLMAPQWLDDLEQQCGIPKSSMSVVGNHGELDREHVVHDVAVLDELLAPHQANSGAIVGAVRESLRRYMSFCNEVVQ